MRIGFNILLMICVLGCFGSTHAACPNITKYDFANATYEIRSARLLASKPIRFRARLQSGSFDESHPPEFLAYRYARLKSVRFGDLTKDGKAEAVIAVEYGTNSASFFLTNYFVFGCSRNGRIRLLGSIEQDRLDARSSEILHESIREAAYIANGILYIRHRAGGFRPSPIYIETFRYKLLAGKLECMAAPCSSRMMMNRWQLNFPKNLAIVG